MVNPYTLPVLGGSLLAAVALGVHLGESSVGLIHPIHFQGPALHPRDRGAAIDESRLPPPAPAYGELYGWEAGTAARAADCGDCEALSARAAYARDYSAEVPWFGAPAEPRAIDYGEAAAGHAAADEMAADEFAGPKHPVMRYASYPIAADEVSAAADEAPELADETSEFAKDPDPAESYPQ